MKTKMTHGLLGSMVTAGVALLANLTAVMPATADVNIGALACQPPFLDQAQNIRWHEHYLINPRGSTETWVVCPIAFDTTMLPDSFNVGAFGNLTSTGGTLCYANVVDLRNQNIPVFNFLDNPGQNMVFSTIMQSQNPSNTLWSSWVTLTKDQVVAAMMNPPSTPVSPGGSVGQAYWTITVNCRLSPGQALNMVSLWPTIAP
jgi:hypothetical protein